jgi:hypothetical protein
MRVAYAPRGLRTVVADAPQVIVSHSATVYLAVIESPGSEGMWELFDAASLDECWMINRVTCVPAGSPQNARGGLLLPLWGTPMRFGLALGSVPRGGSAIFKATPA